VPIPAGFILIDEESGLLTSSIEEVFCSLKNKLLGGV
jgi:hypothetical protein